MTSTGGKASEALARAIGALVEGVTFYDLANAAVAEVRVKVAFEDLGRRKKAQLARLESVTGRSAKDAAILPGIYPMDVVSKVTCYVCGYVAETKAMPNQCPNCGAARYAFEKEITLSKAWEIAADAGRKSAAVFREEAARTDRPTRAVLEELADDEDREAAEAARQLEELRT
ncbi:MAG TPA: hypothetical protein VF992_06910 [Thermoplasmata archaeon]